jgi:hypothetical protein
MYPAKPQIKNNLMRMLEAKHHAAPGHTNFAANGEIGSLYAGGYVASKRDVKPEDRDVKQDKKDAEKRKEARIKKEKKEKNLL